MKPIKNIFRGIGVNLLVCYLSLFAINAFAIDGLQVSIQSSNVLILWPSDSSHEYIVQFRPSLNSTNGWQTLTSSLYGASGTNITVFIHTNAAQYGSFIGSTNIGGGGGSPMPPGPGSTNTYTGTNFDANISGYGFYRVVQDGVRLVNASMFTLTNSVISNSVNVAFEVGNAANDGTGTNVLGNITCAYVIIDGNPFPGDGGVLNSPTNVSPWQFSLDTAYLENGTHTFQVGAGLLNPDNSNGNTVNFSRISDPITITVTNAISYPQWEPEIGEQDISAYFLETTCTNADWSIAIYDSSNNLAQTLTGHTDDGTIAAYWNMVDTNGVARTNADLDPEFSAIVTVGDPITKATPHKKQRKKDWPAHGIWTVSYEDFFKFEYSAGNQMLGAINTFANTTAQYGGYYLYYSPAGSTNDVGQTYPLRYQKTNHPDTNITSASIFLDDQLLRQMLSSTNSRNFFYDGHGDENDIADINEPLLAATIKHRYRFVMIDACSSANGSLDKAFGIKGPGQFPATYYEQTGIRPAAFCGYNIDVTYAVGGPVTISGVTYDDTIPSDVPYFITNFLFYWSTEGEQLQQAISDAGDELPNPGDTGYREDHWKIYGYASLRIDEDNHSSDTW